MIKFIAAFFTCFMILSNVEAQEPGKVEVIKDPLIDSLIARRAAAGNASRTIQGFQVQIYLGSNRQDAYDAQGRFKSLYPEINTYISYTEPNYKVQVGDFRTRLEAQKLANELRQNFDTLLIIPATINQSP